MNEANIKIAVIGATGSVGRIVVSKLLRETNIIPQNLRLFASQNSTGKNICIEGVDFFIYDANTADFNGIQICVFNTDEGVSKKLVPIALDAGAYVVDSSSCFRLDCNVPLIVPPVNINKVTVETKLYAHANCIVSPLAIILAALHRENPIMHANVTTFQSVSGAGKIALDDCIGETQSFLDKKKYQRTFFKSQIAFNIIPQIGEIDDFGNSSEEVKIRKEIQKIVDENIFVNSTAVRVPVLQGHSSNLYLRFKNEFSFFDLKENIKTASSLVLNEKKFADYVTPIDVIGRDEVFVGRVRTDVSYPFVCYNLWICSDNLRRGAATDSVEIVKKIIELLVRHI